MKHIENGLLYNVLSKGEIHLSCYKNTVFISTFTPNCTYQNGRALVVRSILGAECSLMVLLGIIENNSQLIEFAKSIFRYPVGVGKNTEFEYLLQIGSIHMMQLSGIKLHAQTATPPSVFDLPGIYSRHGVGASLEEAIKNILSNAWELPMPGEKICHALNVGVYLNKYTLMKKENGVSADIVVVDDQRVPPKGTRCTYCSELATEYDKENKPVCGIPTNHPQ